MEILSARQICEKYPKNYTAIKVLEKNSCNEIVKAQVLKVYPTLESCEVNTQEIKFFLKLYKNDFDIVYGNYEDYKSTRCVEPIDAFSAFGFMAFEILGCLNLDSFLKEVEAAKNQR